MAAKIILIWPHRPKDRKVRLQRDLRMEVAGPTEYVLQEGEEAIADDH